VPIDTTLSFLKEYLQNHNIDLPFSIDVFIDLLELCTKHSYFSCNDRFYKQSRGLPMGSCLSPVLSNIFMEYFESELIPTINCNIVTWYRYVDDVFAVLPSDTNFDVVLTQLNSLNPSIKFKIEKETNNMLPFLDLCVMRTESNLPKFKIYRKPTHSNMYIHAFSSHTDNIKIGAISNIFLRAYRLSDCEYIDEEIDFITGTFLELGYAGNFIKRAHLRARKTFYNINNKDPINYNNFLILPSICDKKNIRNIVPDNTRIVFRSNNNLKSFVRHEITKSVKHDAGVYVVPCVDCDKKYIGESDNIARRIKQHKNDLVNSNFNSALVKHRIDNDHRIVATNFSTVKFVSDVKQRKLIESFLICNSNNMNVFSTSVNFDPITSKIIYNNVHEMNKLLNKLDNG
jgi:hypothetical protein